MTLIFIDIDHFKKVNDSYGHNFGDELLISLSRIIEKCAKDKGIYCRYGGEEYVIMLPQKAQEQGVLVGECIAEMIQRETFSKCPEFKYTVSTGVFSASPGSEDTLLDFIDKSDQAMYQAKANGRNQICIYSVVNSPEEDQLI